MLLLWVLLGISAAIATIISYYWIKFGTPWYVLSTSLFGVLLFLFSIGWAIYSMNLGIPVKALFGTVAFGMPGILLIFAGWKIMESHQMKQLKH